MDFSRIGIWTTQLGFASTAELREVVSDLETAGFASIWIPESTWADPFVVGALILSATERITVCTGIARVHGRAAQTMANAWASLTGWFPGRFILGLGVSHRPTVERTLRQDYSKPLEIMRTYLDQLDAAPYLGLAEIPRRRVLAALGPKMLRLAGERSDGAHPYNSPVEHTSFARGILGEGPLLIPEVKVLFERDPTVARQIIRQQVGRSLALPNYANNLTRFGFSQEEVGAGSDAVLDALVAWGDDDQVARRIHAHLESGADQVAVQVLSSEEHALPAEGWKRLAGALQ